MELFFQALADRTRLIDLMDSNPDLLLKVFIQKRGGFQQSNSLTKKELCDGMARMKKRIRLPFAVLLLLSMIGSTVSLAVPKARTDHARSAAPQSLLDPEILSMVAQVDASGHESLYAYSEYRCNSTNTCSRPSDALNVTATK